MWGGHGGGRVATVSQGWRRPQYSSWSSCWCSSISSSSGGANPSWRGGERKGEPAGQAEGSGSTHGLEARADWPQIQRSSLLSNLGRVVGRGEKRAHLSGVENADDARDDRAVFTLVLLADELDVTQFAKIEVPLFLQPVHRQLQVQQLLRQEEVFVPSVPTSDASACLPPVPSINYPFLSHSPVD